MLIPLMAMVHGLVTTSSVETTTLLNRWFQNDIDKATDNLHRLFQDLKLNKDIETAFNTISNPTLRNTLLMQAYQLTKPDVTMD